MGEVLSERTDLSEDELKSNLQALDHSERNVRRAVVFVPISFGNDVLDRMGIASSTPGHYLHYKSRWRKPQERKLADEDIFLAAESARSTFIEKFGTEVYLRIASMSAGLDAINKSLKEGRSVEGMRGGTISTIVWGID